MTLVLCGSVLALGEAFELRAAMVASAAAFVTLAFAYRTGLSGGELVYKHGAASAYAEPSGDRPAAEAKQAEEGRHDHDDR